MNKVKSKKHIINKASSRKSSSRKTRKRHTIKKSSVFTNKHYSSGDGFLTSVWGPPAWFFLHTISFNYPVNPTEKNKKDYKDFILTLQNVLPCGHCRENLKDNLKIMPITDAVMKNRDTFSRYLFKLHELVNKRLNKKSGLTYNAVRDRYEHFRSRCTLDTINGNVSIDNNKIIIKGAVQKETSQHPKEKEKEKEKGCVEPLYGKKAKCLLKIVPQEQKAITIEIDKQCMKHTKV